MVIDVQGGIKEIIAFAMQSKFLQATNAHSSLAKVYTQVT